MGFDLRHAAMAASLAVAALMLGGKLAAYAITGSSAILSDALESVVHILATGVAAFSLWYAQRPPTPQHPYGHGKVAYFSAGFEGALIFTAALAIFYTAGHALWTGPRLTRLDAGLAITAALAVVNLGLGLLLVGVGRARNALILVANGKHVLTDMWTSAGVVVGVGAVRATGLTWLDPAVALVVGLNITWSGFALMRRSFRGLLDEAPPEGSERVRACLQHAVDSGALTGYHQLRHRVSNEDVWVEVHMLMPGATPVREAHARVSQIEESIRQVFPGFRVHVTSHVEPTRHEIAHPEGHPGAEDPYREAPEPTAPPLREDDAVRLSGQHADQPAAEKPCRFDEFPPV